MFGMLSSMTEPGGDGTRGADRRRGGDSPPAGRGRHAGLAGEAGTRPDRGSRGTDGARRRRLPGRPLPAPPRAAHGRAGDVALALSTSGGSCNVVEALDETRR